MTTATAIITKNNEVVEIIENPTPSQLENFVIIDGKGGRIDEEWEWEEIEIVELW